MGSTLAMSRHRATRSESGRWLRCLVPLVLLGSSVGCTACIQPMQDCASHSDCGSKYLCVSGACVRDPDAGTAIFVTGDGGSNDAGGRDAGPIIEGPTDAGQADAGPADAGSADAGPRTPRDAGPSGLAACLDGGVCLSNFNGSPICASGAGTLCGCGTLLECSEELGVDVACGRPCPVGCSDGAACRVSCPGGSCPMACHATAACSLHCQGGGCSQQIDSTTSSIASCSGGSCTMVCDNATCELTCAGGNCDITCRNGARCTANCSGDGCAYHRDSSSTGTFRPCQGCTGP